MPSDPKGIIIMYCGIDAVPEFRSGRDRTELSLFLRQECHIHHNGIILIVTGTQSTRFGWWPDRVRTLLVYILNKDGGDSSAENFALKKASRKQSKGSMLITTLIYNIQ